MSESTPEDAATEPADVVDEHEEQEHIEQVMNSGNPDRVDPPGTPQAKPIPTDARLADDRIDNEDGGGYISYDVAQARAGDTIVYNRDLENLGD